MWGDDEVREEVRASADIVSCPQRGVWILYLQQEAVGGFETEVACRVVPATGSGGG